MEIKAEALERARKIKLVIFDVDGVMTDGGIYVGPEGELYKPFNCKDGLGITLAHRSGLRTAIITGRESKQLAYRAGELHITEVMQGHRNKRGAYKELKERQGLTDEEIAYVGDDLIDLPVMLQVGLPMAIADAVAEVKDASRVISGRPGGHGAIRELLEFILKAQGKWAQIVASFHDVNEQSDNIAAPTEALQQ